MSKLIERVLRKAFNKHTYGRYERVTEFVLTGQPARDWIEASKDETREDVQRGSYRGIPVSVYPSTITDAVRVVVDIPIQQYEEALKVS